MFPAKLDLEEKSCPMECASGDDMVLTGHDRLHGFPGEFTVVRCRTCGLIRTNPRPTQESVGFYYPSDYGPYRATLEIGRSAPEKRNTFWKRAARKVLDNETRKIPPLPPGRMLEIGCASGSFLRRMAEGGWQVEGLEISEKLAATARTLGYSVSTSTLEKVPDPVEPYDIIVGWHVLEHLHEPLCALQILNRWVRLGGWLALSVPDASAWEFKIFKERWYGLDLPRHLFHYTPSTLEKLLAKAGWKAEQLFWHNNPNNLFQSLRYGCVDHSWNKLANYLLDMVEGRRHRYLHALLGRLLGTLRASGRMTVWARKI